MSNRDGLHCWARPSPNYECVVAFSSKPQYLSNSVLVYFTFLFLYSFSFLPTPCQCDSNNKATKKRILIKTLTWYGRDSNQWFFSPTKYFYSKMTIEKKQCLAQMRDWAWTNRHIILLATDTSLLPFKTAGWPSLALSVTKSSLQVLTKFLLTRTLLVLQMN